MSCCLVLSQLQTMIPYDRPSFLPRTPAHHHAHKRIPQHNLETITLNLSSPSSGDNLVGKSSGVYTSQRISTCSTSRPIFRRLLCQRQTTTCGRERKSSEHVDGRHGPKKGISSERAAGLSLPPHSGQPWSAKL